MRNISWLFVCFVCIIWCLMGLVRVRVRARVWFVHEALVRKSFSFALFCLCGSVKKRAC